MSVRWMIERDYKNNDHELLQLIKVYAPGENKELVKKENRKWTYERHLIKL